MSMSISWCTEIDWNGSSFEKVESLDTIEPSATSVLWCKHRSVYDY